MRLGATLAHIRKTYGSVQAFQGAGFREPGYPDRVNRAGEGPKLRRLETAWELGEGSLRFA
jgi:hypothetical protein